MAHDVTSQNMASDFAAEFAAFSSSLTIQAVPVHVLEVAKADLLDTLGCAVAGFTAPGVPGLLALVQGWAGAREAGIWGTDVMVPAHNAALINGMMAHARDYDDTHDAAVLHAGVSVVPAALAAAEISHDATGADLLAGIVAGLELICRLGTATQIGIIESGFMYTSLFGHFAATAAAARVLGLDAEATANALGIVYSQAAGTHQVTRDAALTKRMQPGFAAQAGVLAVSLTRAGLTGTRHTFEGVDGLFHSYLRGRFDPVVLREGLGTRFEMENLSFKPFPCCRFNHSAIEAALEIRDALGGDTEDILAIRCGVNAQAHAAVCEPVGMRKAPETVVQAQFALPYCVATALERGDVGMLDFTPERLSDPTILGLSSLVETYVDLEIEREWSRNVSPAKLEVVTGRGLFCARIDLPRGHPNRPMDQAGVQAKLADCFVIGKPEWERQRMVRLFEGVMAIEAYEHAWDIAALMAQ